MSLLRIPANPSNHLAVRQASQDPVCSGNNWDRGESVVDPNAPPGPYPIVGERVYITDPNNYCINLPNPDDPWLIENYYSKGNYPTIVAAEGHVRAFCVGKQTAGSLPMPYGGITAAHVVKNSTAPGMNYMQITGRLNCDVLKIDCKGDNGGQYDSVPYRNCGKEPYSGVDKDLSPPDFIQYIEQAGDNIFCMRTCQGGTQFNDPCNVKNDTAGCGYTMNMVDREGFTISDVAVNNGAETTVSVTTTAPSTTTTTTNQAAKTATSAAGTSAAATATSKSSATAVGVVSMALQAAFVAAAYFLF